MSKQTNFGANALATLNLAPFTPGGRFLFPYAYSQIKEELTRFRELLKRIEWDGAAHRPGMFCASCGGFQPTEGHPPGTTETMFNTTLHYGHKPDCELAALMGAP